MIYVRRFLLTLVMTAVCLIAPMPITVEAGGIGIALLIDIFLTPRSRDLPLYRKGLDFAAPMPGLRPRDSLRLQSIAILAMSAVALVPKLFGVPAPAQHALAMAAMLIGGAAATYCGFLLFESKIEPRQILFQIRVHTGELGFTTDFLPSRPRGLMIGLFRILGAILFKGLSLILLLSLPMADLDLHFAALFVAAACFYQFSFQFWFHAMFVLRWWLRPHDLLVPWHPLAEK